ncbi:MAG: response regulator [Chitinispirillia bacterium]|nr:response regulator [Chitinispirillia bacterium]MCL2242081.1 response regulator [Chitinispirillia bacterium]
MGQKLLIVDDKREIRQLVRATLEFEGWEVVEAETGDDGVEAALEHIPDLVIMDMVMPGKIDGMEATRRIKADPATAACKVIMLSGSEKELRGAALEAGVEEFIKKPFSPLDLIEKVENLFGDRT